MMNNSLGGSGLMNRTVSVGRFASLKIDRLISEGGFGFVYAVTDTSTGQKYALKQINAQTEEQRQLITNEMQVWRQVSHHENIVTVYEAQIKQTSPGMHQISIVSELCTEGTLFDLIVRFGGKGLSEQ